MHKKDIKFNIISLLSAIIMIAIDQVTKILAVNNLSDGPFDIIKGVLQFLYLENHGAAWGILAGKRVFFIIITLIVVGLVVAIYLKTPNEKKYIPLIIVQIMLISGAVGNFIDRLMLGYVRDFIYFELIDFPVFNVADIFVVLSAIVLCFLILFVYKDEDLTFLSIKKKE